jgi:tRNA-dihydrouridine synthase 2
MEYAEEEDDLIPLSTPPDSRPNPEPPGSGAPFLPSNELLLMIPAGISRQDAVTPTPGGGDIHGIL